MADLGSTAVGTVGEVEPEGLRCHRAGVQALVEIAGSLNEPDWTRPSGCAGWTGADLAGHALTVINLWDHILDRAFAGDDSIEFAWDHFDTWNADALARLPDAWGQNAYARSPTVVTSSTTASLPPTPTWGLEHRQ